MTFLTELRTHLQVNCAVFFFLLSIKIKARSYMSNQSALKEIFNTGTKVRWRRTMLSRITSMRSAFASTFAM